MKKTIFMTVLILLLIPALVFGGGFNIYEHGARASAMGGAFIAYASGPSSIFFNPAGMASVDGTVIEFGSTALMLKSTFYGPTPHYAESSIEDKVHPPSHFYVTHSLNDKINIGLGFYTPFGLGMDWTEDWVGRYIITELDLKTYYFNPAVSYKLNDKVSFGAGVTYVMSSALIRKRVNYSPRSIEGLLDFSGNGSGFCYNVGFQADLNEKFSVGASYRSKHKINFDDGKATIGFPSTSSAIVNAEIAALFPDVSGSTKIGIPDILALGIGIQPMQKLRCEFNYVRFGWSNYDKLVITIPEEEQTAAVKTLAADKNYKDGGQYRFGLEYTLSEKLQLRAGYIYDPTPVPDESLEPLLPDADRNDYSFGFGYKFGKWNFDMYYMLLDFQNRTTTTNRDNFNGSYKTIGHLIGGTFTYSL